MHTQAIDHKLIHIHPKIYTHTQTGMGPVTPGRGAMTPNTKLLHTFENLAQDPAETSESRKRLYDACVCCSVLQWVAVCCSVLQCVAVCCSVWQCVAVCYSVLQCVASESRKRLYDACVCCSVMQCDAV